LLRSRLAPTPSGYLHLGNAFSFLLTWLIVRRANGNLLLRIDDLDAERKRPEYVQDIFDSLEWLQLTYDEGPRNAADFESNWSQQLRLESYNRAIQLYQEFTSSVFACSCSRAQLQTLPPGASCACAQKQLPHDTPGAALRFFVPGNTIVTFDDLILGETSVNVSQAAGSFAIRRRDGIPAYQLASVTDDIYYSINFIVRGQDLLGSTAAQLFMASAPGQNEFSIAQFAHHPLLGDGDGKKLSKSEGALALRTMRQDGIAPSEIYRRFAKAIGMAGNVRTPEELLDAFGSYDLKMLGDKFRQ